MTVPRFNCFSGEMSQPRSVIWPPAEEIEIVLKGGSELVA